jgi:hypothetical protein
MKKVVPILLFIIALVVRLVVLFWVTEPQNPGTGWYTDVFHHWQIAYLTKEIGLAQGKFWDLMGMEYFWGAGQTLLITLLMKATGSIDIVMLRLVSTLAGAGTTVLLFVLGRRYWNVRVGWAVALFYALNPVSVFTDQSGLQVSMAVFLLLLGITTIEKPLIAGLLWGLAGTFRASYWVLAGILTGASWVLKKGAESKMFLTLGVLIISLVYMKLLMDKTGNPIYPIWWNVKGNLVGEWNSYQPPGWFKDELLPVHSLAVGLLVAGVGTGLVTVIKRVKWWPLGLYGAVKLIILGAMGLTSYSWNYTLERFWVSRLWSWPYTFLFLLLTVGWFGVVAKKGWLKKFRDVFWPVWVGILVVVWLVAWPVIWRGYQGKPLPGTQVYEWELVQRRAEAIARYYRGGKFLVPASRADIIYLLVKDYGVEGKDLVSQQFDVYEYNPQIVERWPLGKELVIQWLKDNEIRWILADEHNNYHQLADAEPEHLIPYPTKEGYIMYEVVGL